jgi:hypothetical protein
MKDKDLSQQYTHRVEYKLKERLVYDQVVLAKVYEYIPDKYSKENEPHTIIDPFNLNAIVKRLKVGGYQ